jgi:hypothetical protein
MKEASVAIVLIALGTSVNPTTGFAEDPLGRLKLR